jgi:hypothetical protein
VTADKEIKSSVAVDLAKNWELLLCTLFISEFCNDRPILRLGPLTHRKAAINTEHNQRHTQQNRAGGVWNRHTSWAKERPFGQATPATWPRNRMIPLKLLTYETPEP